jgi:uncharacterized protein with GYD domain
LIAERPTACFVAAEEFDAILSACSIFEKTTEEKTMACYITLLKFTEKGAQAIKNTATRAEQFRDAAAKAGVKVVGQYWTLGNYDGVLVLESEKAENVLSCLAELTAAGHVLTHTLPAYTADEIKTVLK